MDHLVAFMRANGIPLTGLDGGISRVLIVGEGGPADASAEEAARSRMELRSAANGFEAGVVAQQFRPHAVVLHTGADPAEVIGICRNIKSSPSFGDAWVLASCRQEQQEEFLAAQGFAACVPCPYTLADLLAAMDRLSVQTTQNQGRSWRA